MYKLLQHLGRSLMLPVAVLPAAAIIVGIGHVLDALNILPQAALFFTSVGTTILEQLGILFAIGVAIGLARSDKGTAGLAALIGFLIMNAGKAFANGTFLKFGTDKFMRQTVNC